MSDTQTKYIEKLEKEAEVMKEMLKENDTAIAVANSKNEKLESDLDEATSKVESLTVKTEKLESDLNEAQSLLAGKEKTEAEDGDYESKCKELEALVEELQSKLSKYEELGEAEDVKEAMESAAEALDAMSAYGTKDVICEKLESYDATREKLESYEAIGKPEEISAVVSEMTKMKFESSAEKLSGECGISLAAARSALEKLESYDDAKEFIGSIVTKAPVAGEEVKEKTESEEESVTSPVAGEKFESEIDIMKKAIRKL